MPRQLPQQVADVGADAVVVQLPGVDGDAHVRASYQPELDGVGHPLPELAGRAVSASAAVVRHCPFQPQVHAQQRRPARMVLLVERELAAPVRARFIAAGARRARPAAQMRDRRRPA